MSSRSLLLAIAALVLAGCSSNHSTGGDAGAVDASTADVQEAGGADADAAPAEAGPAPVGAPCIPFQELSKTFAGFSTFEVTVDQGESAACTSGVCLVNHFQGRASCPYGQTTGGQGNADAGACTVPGSGAPVMPNSPTVGQQVLPQCTDRTANLDVTCSCRCADPDGQTDDAGTYCTCPTGTICSQIVPELVQGDPLAGGYCVPMGTTYDPTTVCPSTCDPAQFEDPTQANCGVGDDAGALPSASGQATTYLATTIRLQNGLCLPQALPTAGSGMAACQIFFVLAAPESPDGGDAGGGDAGDAGTDAGSGEPCAGPGLSSVDPGVAAAVDTTLQAPLTSPVCALAQLPATPCATSTTAGWCYLAGTSAPSGCREAIEVSKPVFLPAGASAVLGCP